MNISLIAIGQEGKTIFVHEYLMEKVNCKQHQGWYSLNPQQTGWVTVVPIVTVVVDVVTVKYFTNSKI